MTVTADTAWLLGLVLVMAVGAVGASVAWRWVARETREADRVRLRAFLEVEGAVEGAGGQEGGRS